VIGYYFRQFGFDFGRLACRICFAVMFAVMVLISTSDIVMSFFAQNTSCQKSPPQNSGISSLNI
jgi:hypothetical protein